MPQKKGKKKVRVQDLKPKKDTKGGGGIITPPRGTGPGVQLPAVQSPSSNYPPNPC